MMKIMVWRWLAKKDNKNNYPAAHQKHHSLFLKTRFRARAAGRAPSSALKNAPRCVLVFG